MNPMYQRLALVMLIITPVLPIKTVLASSSYSSSVDFSYSISATNRNIAGDLQGLLISDSYNFFPATESGSSTAVTSYAAFSGLDIEHGFSLHVQDSLLLGAALSEYFSSLVLNLNNNSENEADIFDVTLNYRYSLSTAVAGEFADSFASFTFSNENYELDGHDYVYASASIPFVFDEVTDTQGSFSFALGNGQSEAFYFDSAATGALEATVVPVPAAFWLFASGFLGVWRFRGKRVPYID